MNKNYFQIHFILLLSISYATSLSSTDDRNLEELTCSLPENLVREIDSYKLILKKIYTAATGGSYRQVTIDELRTFVNKFNHRFSGSKTLENSIDYMLKKLKDANLENVHGEEVMVPHWVRGNESAKLVAPIAKDLRMLGLGYSIGTPPQGITAKAIVVKSFADLKEKAAQIPGKIVVFNQEYVNYGETVKYRSSGASEAAKLGAVAVLIRSITPVSLGFPHTGMMDYENNVKKIPAACITVEDAQFLNDLADKGKEIVVHVQMDAKTYPDVTSRNVIAEIVGRKNPEKVVIVSGHIDNWDVGQGAMDDGGGAFISWNALALLKKLNLAPKRTIRSILWTAEEMGCIGSSQYIKTHKSQEHNLQFVMESDAGTFTPLGLEVSGTHLVKCIVQRILSLLKPLETYDIKNNADGPDIEEWVTGGIPGASLWNLNSKYFYYHHSVNDTILVENDEDLDRGTAIFASVAYVLANIGVDLPRHE